MAISSKAPTTAGPITPPGRSRRSSREYEQKLIGMKAISPTSLLAYLFLLIAIIYFLTPLWWLAMSATKDNTDLFSSFGLWIAHFNLLQNLHDTFTYEGGLYVKWIFNTILYAVVGGVLGMLVSLMAGYGLAKYSFKGRGVVFVLVLGALLVPVTTLALPTYLLMSKIHLVNTYWAVLLPSMLSPIGVFLARVFAASSVPNELIDAARVDGAGEFRIFLRVAMPLLLPGMVTIFLLQFVAIWNNFFLPLVVLNDPTYYPINLGLATWNFDPASHQLLFNLIVTGSLLAVLPLIALFLFLQRYWRAGLALGGVAG